MTILATDGRAHDAPRGAVLVPLVSLAFSVPPLLVVLAAGGMIVYLALTGQPLGSAVPSILVSGSLVRLGVSYVILGPMLAIVLCVSQRARSRPDPRGSSALRITGRSLDSVALVIAGLAVAVMLLAIATGMLLRQGT